MKQRTDGDFSEAQASDLRVRGIIVPFVIFEFFLATRVNFLTWSRYVNGDIQYYCILYILYTPNKVPATYGQVLTSVCSDRHDAGDLRSRISLVRYAETA